MSTRRPITMALAVLLGLCILGNASAAAFPGDDPTEVRLKSVEAIPGVAQVEVRWTTLSELDTAGFNVMHSTSAGGPWEQANKNLILAQGEGMSGASYSFTDTGLAGGITYTYFIQELTNTGGTNNYRGEWIRSATPRHGFFLPFIVRQ